MMSSTRNFFEIAGLFCITLLIFLWGVNGQEVIGFDSRFYLFALEMWRHGPSWFPTTYQQPYPDYPATATFLIYLAASFLGGMSKLAAVLPTALAGSATVVFTYQIGALHNKRWGWCAACCLLCTLVFLKSGRSISLDMYPALITVWCFYLIHAAKLEHHFDKVQSIYPLLLLGFMFRGPVGLIIPTGVICSYYFLDRNSKDFFFAGIFALVLLIFSSLMLLGLAHHVGGDPFVNDVLRMEAFGRMDAGHLPWSFYFTKALESYALSFPLAMLVAIGVLYYSWRLRKFQRSPEFSLLVKLIGWVLIIVVGMSIPGDKKVRYILPIAPALALLAAYPFSATAKEWYFRKLHGLFLGLFLSMPSLLLIGWGAFLTFMQKGTLGLQFHYEWMVPLLVALQAGNIVVFWLLAKKVHWRDGLILGIATISFVAVYLFVIERVEMFVDRTREFVVQVEAQRKLSHATLVFYDEHRDGLPIKYLINMSTEEPPVFISGVSTLMSYAKHAYFVTRQSNFNDLPLSVASQFHVIAQDRMGHVPVIVFSNR